MACLQLVLDELDHILTIFEVFFGLNLERLKKVKFLLRQTKYFGRSTLALKHRLRYACNFFDNFVQNLNILAGKFL